MITKEQQGIISMNGKEVWRGPWWKVWHQVQTQVAAHRNEKIKIEVELL